MGCQGAKSSCFLLVPKLRHHIAFGHIQENICACVGLRGDLGMDGVRTGSRDRGRDGKGRLGWCKYALLPWRWIMKTRWYLDSIRQTLFPRRGGHSFSRTAQPPRWRMQVEELESRLVPSAFVGIYDGVLRIDSNGSDNDIAIDHFQYYPFLGPATRVEANGSATVWAEGSFNKILINTLLSGGDRINLRANAKPVEMYLGNGNAAYVGELYNNLDRIQGFVTVMGYGFGDRLSVSDFNNPRSETWQLGSGDMNQGFVSRAGAATIVFGGMKGGLFVYGTGAPSAYDVAQTHGFMTTLLPGSNGDTVNVRRTTGELDVNSLGNGAVINVSDGGSVQNIRGPVVVSTLYAGAYATVNVDDQYDRDRRYPEIDTYTPDGDSAYIRVYLAPAPISSRCASTRDMIVRTGVGPVLCQVLTTSPMGPGGAGVLTLEGHSDQTSVYVGAPGGTVQGIRGTLRITNPRVFTGLLVYDNGDTAHQTVSLDSVIIGDGLYGQITGLAPAAIQYRYNQTSYLKVFTGPGGASLNVAGCGDDTYLNSDGSNNSILLGGARGLQGLQGQVTIANYTGRVNVDINDVTDTDNRTVAVTTYTPDVENVEIFGLTPRPVTINSLCIGRLDIEGGSGGDTFEVQNTSSTYSFPTTIYTNFGNNTVNVHATSKSPLAVYLSGNDRVNIGDAANGLALVGTPVTVVGNAPGAGDTINVIDQANPNAETYIVADTYLSTSTPQIVTFQDFDTLVLFPGFNANTTVIDAHDPGLYTLVISYDAPAAAPHRAGGAGVRRSDQLMAEHANSVLADFFAGTAREGEMTRASAASEAMLVELLTRAAYRQGESVLNDQL
jgi:hypothetical protein